MTFFTLVVKYCYGTSSCSIESCPRLYKFFFFMYEDYHDTTTNKLMYQKIILFCTCFYVNETTILFFPTTSHMFVSSNFQLKVNHVENLDHEGFYLLDQITFSLLLTIYNKSCYICQSCPNSIYIPCVCCYVHLFVLFNLYYYSLSKNGS